ncbi:MAG: LysM peptidoglycan-binding domain-containing protein [Alphaproteobacteria bacterium]
MRKSLRFVIFMGVFLVFPFFVGGGAALCDEVITVKSDETVYSIARRYKIKPQEIIKKNKLLKPYYLQKGQRITVPFAIKAPAEKKEIKDSSKLDVPPKAVPDLVVTRKKKGAVLQAVEKGNRTPSKKADHKTQAIVKDGDTLYSIARSHGISTRELIEINNLKAPFFLYVGMHLKLKSDEKTTYVIQDGDIISNIANKFSVSEETLAKVNNLKRPYKMSQLAGRTLLIPLDEESAEKMVKKKKAIKGINKRKVSGSTLVKDGDTLYSIARKYNISTKELIQINNLKPPFFLYTGMVLHLPVTTTYTVRQDDTIYSISRKFNIDMHTLVKANKMAKPYRIYKGKKLYIPQVANLVTKKKGSFFTRTKKRYFSGKTGRIFAWPVIGRVLASFGVQGKGKHNDGINISAKEGTAVKASGNGTVLYTGNALGGFGELILLKHKGGWVTAYAHNKTLLVKRGEDIISGQIIARIGESGNVKKPQLHFQIRRNNRVVNPMKYLARRSS